ncbi:RsiV family protein [Mycobacterium sp. SMC-13]|uniref:RsiV family protein n=1 Tax=Mycobacterium sp. SMC-13 TaxID=3381626 RepID=UPI003875DAEA
MRISVLALAAVVTFLSVAPAASAQQACGALGGTPDATGMCRIHEVGTGYERTVAFPVDYPDQRAVADFLAQDRDGFVGWVADFGGGRVYTETVTRTVYRSARSQSLVLKVVDPTGLAHEGHPDIRYRTFTYGAGGPVTIDSLFGPGSDPVAILTPVVQSALKARNAALIEPDRASYRNFALTDDAVTFFFGESQLAGNGGPLTVAVPVDELGGRLQG